MAVLPSSRESGSEALAWRYEQYVDNGLPSAEAIFLANQEGIDWHEFLELRERGCPPLVAYRILYPLVPA